MYFVDCARSPKEKRSRESEHRTNNDRNEDKILHPIKMSQSLSSRDRKPVHNNSVDKVDTVFCVCYGCSFQFDKYTDFAMIYTDFYICKL